MILVRWLAALVPHSDVGDGAGDVFFRRWTLFKSRRLGVAIYLHQFFRSDRDRCEHDHPWPFTTLILRGGYHEQINGVRRRRDARCLSFPARMPVRPLAT